MITFRSYLGANTLRTIELIAAAVGDALDIETEVDQESALNSAHAMESAAQIDVLWMCGRLFVDMADDTLASHEAIAAPVFEGEHGPTYHSVVIARPDGPDTIAEAVDRRVAVNEFASWSGHHALRRHLGNAWFSTEVLSGSHASSIEMVRSGHADVAAIDSTIWAAAMADGDTDGLQVIDRTKDWPSPPFVIRRALYCRDDVIAALVRCAPIGVLSGIEVSSVDAYRAMR